MGHIVVLNYSTFLHSRIVDFCKTWPVLKNEHFAVCSPVAAKYMPLALTLSEAKNPHTVFGLARPLTELSVVFIMPPARYNHWPAVELLLQTTKQQAHSLRTVQLSDSINGQLIPGRIEVFNSNYL